MGLADRDYARPRHTDWRGIGGLGPGRFSINTWLILINAAVFILGNVILANVYLQSSAGTFRFQDVTPEEVRRGYVDHSITLPVPGEPGLLFHPIFEASAAPPITQHPITRDFYDANRRPVRQIGGARFLNMPVVMALGHFSTGKVAELEIWRFVTFQFIHGNFMHILFNMLGLWFVGGLVEAHLGRRRYAAFYLLCGAAGAMAYLILNLLGWGLGLRLPGVLFSDPYTPLVGASAGVFGVLLASAFIRPRELVLVLFIIPMELRLAVYLFTFLAAMNLIMGGGNAGGDAAHIGGAIAGAFLIRRPHLLHDLTLLVGPRRSSKSGRAPRTPGSAPGRSTREEIDRILAKITLHGIDSLTPIERETLRRAREDAER